MLFLLSAVAFATEPCPIAFLTTRGEGNNIGEAVFVSWLPELRSGDRIVSVRGKPRARTKHRGHRTWSKQLDVLTTADTVKLIVERDGENHTVMLPHDRVCGGRSGPPVEELEPVDGTLFGHELEVWHNGLLRPTKGAGPARCIVRVTVGPFGVVEEAEAMGCGSPHAEAAEAAAIQNRYYPMWTVGGPAMAVETKLSYRFL